MGGFWDARLTGVISLLISTHAADLSMKNETSFGDLAYICDILIDAVMT